MDAAGFVALFRASNVVWHEGDADPPRWIFRGHRNAVWRLKPRAWRTAAEGNPLHSIIKQLNSAAIEYHDEIKSGTTLHQALAWTHAERIVLNEFRRIGWQLGFDLNEPLSSYSMDMELFPPVVIDNTRDNDCFSPFISSSDIGVAQHYGVPTRFLDWTFNPIFAVFFALDDYEQGLDQTDLCVWAFPDPSSSAGRAGFGRAPGSGSSRRRKGQQRAPADRHRARPRRATCRRTRGFWRA